jgi:UDP-glucose 4,6-dehydratase
MIMILIFGKNGYVSKRFQEYFDYKEIPYSVVSLKDKPTSYWAEEMIRVYNPTFVLNCIGYTGKPNVDGCEDNKQECLFVNVILAEKITQACEKYNIPLGYVGSGCIYQEDKVEWWKEYKETDFPNFCFDFKNCSWYSGTKALAESLVQKTWHKSYIWRLRMPFNHLENEKNYIGKILKYDKIWSAANSLTNLDEFVKNCYKCIEKKIPYGIYNMTNSGGINAKEVLNIAKKFNITKNCYEYFSDESEFLKTVKTPRSNCVLDSNKIENAGIHFLPVEESLIKTFEIWNKEDSTIFW